MSVRSILLVLAGLALVACVAPEQPEPVRSTSVPRPAAASASGAAFEPAPVPNRRVGPVSGSAIIRVQH